MKEIQEAREEDKSLDYAMKVCGLDGTALPGTAQFTVANYIAGLRLRLATPKHEGQDWWKIAEALVNIDWCIGYELTEEQYISLDRVRTEAAKMLALAPAAPEPRPKEPRP